MAVIEDAHVKESAMKKSRASLQAGVLVENALSAGMTLLEIAEKIGTGLSTIQRWRSTGKGEAALVRKLERLIGAVEVTPEELSCYLAEEYIKDEGNQPFAIFDSDLYRVVGPLLDTNNYLEEVRKKLRLRGYELLQTRKNSKVLYHIIAFDRIRGITKDHVRDMKVRWRENTDDFSPDDNGEVFE